MKGYVILQEGDRWCLEGYYMGDSYVVHGILYGCFDRDIKKAKVYRYKKNAEIVVSNIYKFANASPIMCKIVEIEVE